MSSQAQNFSHLAYLGLGSNLPPVSPLDENQAKTSSLLEKSALLEKALLGFKSLSESNKQKALNIIQALECLCRLSQKIQIEAISSFYVSAPVGLDELDAQDFVNAACKISTNLEALELLAVCQEVEKLLGRTRRKDGPKSASVKKVFSRTIDLDLLFFDDLICNTEVLTLPHPYWQERDFVKIPLKEIWEEKKGLA